MSPRRWILLTLLFTFVAGGGFVLVNVWLDIYGLFRDTHGRRLPVYDTERRAKYLLSLHYVPQGFDAILIGSSVTANWNTSGIEPFRTYNESIDGGNITEQKVLAERVLLSPGLRAAICVLHPYLTDSAGLKSKEMSEREYFGALGSTALLRSYKLLFSTSLGRGEAPWDASGTEASEAPTELNPVLARMMAPGSDLHVDEVAFEEYRALVGELRGRGVALVAVVPPTREDLLGPKREEMDRYVRRAWTIFSPGDVLVDFNAPAYAAFRLDRSHFTDGIHLSRGGAAEVVKLLNQRLLEAFVSR